MRKQIFLLLAVYLFSIYGAIGQSPILNYNPTRAGQYQRVLVPLRPTQDTADVTMSALVENVSITTDYFDSLGRPIQKVVRQASPLKKDYVAPVAYDKFGRTTTQYLPYVQQSSNTNDGKYKATALIYDSVFYKAIFPSDNSFFSTTQIDASPLQRVLKVMAEGDSWTGAGRGKTLSQRANAVSDSVRQWTIDISSEDDVPSTSAVYAPGGLMVEEVVDENNQKKIIYKDELGRLILSKVQIASSPGTGHYGWLCTYYIYDEMNNLRMVLPPKSVEALMAVSWNLAGNSAIRTGLCYAYYYDSKGRMIMKYIPGMDKSYIAYDLLGRVVMTQDANLRLTNQWAFVKYDGQSRPIKSGLITSSLIKDSIIAQAFRSSDYPTLSGTYSISSESYFDDYSWTSGTPLSSSLVTTNINSTNFYTSYNAFPEYAQSITVSNRIRGAVTGSKKIIIGSSSYLYTLSIYDQYGRVIQVKETNITGGTDVATSQYSFSGRVLRSHVAHEKSGTNAQTHTILTKYNYDHAGRIISIVKNADGSGDKIISENSYNELGQVISKKLAPAYNSNAGIETLVYEYNMRGWLLGMNRDFVKDVNTTAWFGYEVAYENTTNIISGQSYTAAQYNGNITGITWKSRGDAEKRKYDFAYDAANRLTAANFNQYTSSSFNKSAGIDFSVSGMTYDANGNILNMNQKGWKLGGSKTIDSLLYGYNSNSNQSAYVNDRANDTASLLGDFKEYTNNTSQDYNYDVNGNSNTDNNKKISSIIYNYLNLPDSIRITGKGTIKYAYDVTGNKIKKVTVDSTGGTVKTTSTLYLNGFIYQNDTLQFLGHEEGRIRVKGAGFVYDYFIKDHLGNVRMMLTEDTQSDQYPAATMETANATVEESYYSGLETRSDVPLGYPRISGNAKVAKIIGNSNLGATRMEIGPAMLLKVMSGDKFNFQVNSWWKDIASPDSSTNPLGLGQLLSIIGGNTVANSGHFNSGEVQNSTELYNSVSSFLGGQSFNTSRPKAFVNWILFDEHFNYVSSNSGFEQVGADTIYTTHTRTDMPVDKNGYLFIYVSNETPNINVYFDNLQVTHTRGPLIEEDHYYPFGLGMSGISSKALSFGKENKYKYNGGVELESELGLDCYKTFFRQYDPQIGRFTGVDILAELYSELTPYQFGANNPILFNDPTGALLGGGGGVKRYMDDQGNLWHSPSTLQGTGFGYTEVGAFDNILNFDSGGSSFGGGGGGGTITPQMVKSYYTILWRGTDRRNIDADYSGCAHEGQGFNVSWNYDGGLSVPTLGSMFVSTQKFERLLAATYQNEANQIFAGDKNDIQIDRQLAQRGIINAKVYMAAYNRFALVQEAILSGLVAEALIARFFGVAATGLGKVGFKELQTLTKTYSAELNAFFRSGGTQGASKEALQAYKELATRILNGTGGAPARKLTETALKEQSQRIEMINKTLETIK